MTDTNITCPKCGAEIPLTEAVSHRVREQQLKKAISHTAMLYGGIQGIAGREALPEVPSLALPAPATELTPPAA